MKVDNLGVVLEAHEERYAVVRSDPRAYIGRVLLGVLWILTPWFFLFPLLRLHWLGVLCVGLLTLSGMLFLLQSRARWLGSALVLTNLRCVDVTRQGFAAPIITSVPWSDIQEIVVAPARLWQRVLRLSNIRIDIRSAPQLSLLLPAVRRGELVRKLVNEVHYMVNQK